MSLADAQDVAPEFPPLRIDGDRLWADLLATAQFGAVGETGITRLALSEEDRMVRAWFKTRCEALGCSVVSDVAGNMFATYPGTDPSLAPVAVGSHLDTQPGGGRFDGVLGVLAGVAAIETLALAGVRTRRPITVVNWTNEEGSRFAPAMMGSGLFAGSLFRGAIETVRDRDGVSVGEALDKIAARGVVPLGHARFSAYLELHIEQGVVLETEGCDIGVVSGVQGLSWYDVTFHGTEAHAGSTPMNRRNDAMVKAAKLVLAVEEIAHSTSGVGCVGAVDVQPNSRNVVPGRVQARIDFRHPQSAGLDDMDAGLKKHVAEIDGSAEIRHLWRKEPVAFDPACRSAIEAAAASNGLSTHTLWSGAGHDAANLTDLVPSAMIFVPSLHGVSHNVAEYTSPDQCRAGAQVLLDALLMMAAAAARGE